MKTAQHRTMEMRLFKIYLTEKGDSIRTIQQKQNIIISILSEGEFSITSAKEFLYKKRVEGCLKSTLNKYKSAIKSYCEYKNLTWGSEFKRQSENDSHETVLLSDTEIEAIINFVPLPNKMSIFFLLLSHCGARPDEIRTLTVNDISDEVVFIPDGKTGGRYIPIPEYVSKHVKKYIKTLQTEVMFPARNSIRKGLPISETVYLVEFRRRRDALGITKRARPYSFRHSKAQNLGDCMTLKDLMAFLGHKKPDTTLKYLRSNLGRLRKGIKKDPFNKTFLPLTERFESAVKDIIERAESEAEILNISLEKDENTFQIRLEIK